MLSSVLLPLAEASINDQQLDGVGDALNSAEFSGLVQQAATGEDRAIVEFDVSSWAAGNDNLVLNFDLKTLSAGTAIRPLSVSIYAGNGSADVSDFSAPATLVGIVRPARGRRQQRLPPGPDERRSGHCRWGLDLRGRPV